MKGIPNTRFNTAHFALISAQTETAAARPRLEALRCVMLGRGLAVSTLDGGNSEASNYSLPSRPAGPGPNC